MTPILNTKEEIIRPCAIVADGPTAKSIQSLIIGSNFRRAINLEMFEEREIAFEYLEGLLSRSL